MITVNSGPIRLTVVPTSYVSADGPSTHAKTCLARTNKDGNITSPSRLVTLEDTFTASFTCEVPLCHIVR